MPSNPTGLPSVDPRSLAAVQEALVRTPDLESLIPDSEVLPPDEVTSGARAESSFDGALMERVIHAIIQADLEHGKDGVKEGGTPLTVIVDAVRRAGATAEQYLQMLDNPEFLRRKRQKEHGIYVESRRGPLLRAAGNKAMLGDISALRVLFEESAIPEDDIAQELRRVGPDADEYVQERANKLWERMLRSLAGRSRAQIDHKLLNESRRLAATRQTEEERESRLDDLSCYAEEA